jgi:acyl carrier protein
VITTDFVEPLRLYLVEHHLDGRADLHADTPLLEWGVIDSLTLVDFLAYIDERFGIEVPAAEVTPANFETIEHVASLLSRLSGASADPA